MCDGIDAKNCVRCRGKTNLRDWWRTSTGIGHYSELSAQEKACCGAMSQIDSDLEERLLRHRIENFSAKVEPCRHPQAEGELSLSVTTNGFQWQSMSLLPVEMAEVIAVLAWGLRSAEVSPTAASIDTRLIAAAPDLLAALRELERLAAPHIAGPNGECPGLTLGEQAILSARAAISKATGEKNHA